VGPHRLKHCNIDRTELKEKYPDLPTTNEGKCSKDTTSKQAVDSNKRAQQDKTAAATAQTETTSKQKSRPKQTTEKQKSTNTFLYSPAIAILRKRQSPDGLEFLVKFEDGDREWVNQANVSPALKADFLIKKQREFRARRN
jgi:hypothetical protein